MKKIIYRNVILKTFLALVFVQFSAAGICAQIPAARKTPETKTVAADLQTVTQIDGDALSKLLKPNGKPLLVNFWATWCGPCVEEFPELVKINSDYKEKLDVKAISLDDAAEINTGVPKFLAKVKSEIPAYLLKTADEDTAIQNVDKSWQGGLPFTILLKADGTIAYTRQGIINPKILREEIDKLTAATQTATFDFQLPRPKIRSTEEGKIDARKDLADGKLIIKRYGLTAAISASELEDFRKKYRIEIIENGCGLLSADAKYFNAYNETMKAEITRRFGHKTLARLPL